MYYKVSECIYQFLVNDPQTSSRLSLLTAVAAKSFKSVQKFRTYRRSVRLPQHVLAAEPRENPRSSHSCAPAVVRCEDLVTRGTNSLSFLLLLCLVVPKSNRLFIVTQPATSHSQTPNILKWSFLQWYSSAQSTKPALKYILYIL